MSENSYIVLVKCVIYAWKESIRLITPWGLDGGWVRPWNVKIWIYSILSVDYWLWISNGLIAVDKCQYPRCSKRFTTNAAFVNLLMMEMCRFLFSLNYYCVTNSIAPTFWDSQMFWHLLPLSLSKLAPQGAKVQREKMNSENKWIL